MNRLVIIGNGFDLAHGLKTSYEDFIIHLINSSFKELYEEGKVKNKHLFSIEISYGHVKEDFSINSIQEIFNNKKIEIINDYTFLRRDYKSTNVNQQRFKITFHSALFYNLISKNYWTDIEKTYFDLLTQIYNNEQQNINNNNLDLKLLNNHFEYIKEKFIEYILQLDDQNLINENLHFQIEKCFFENNIYDYYGEQRKKELLRRFEDRNLNNITIINFNYTDKINKYISKITPFTKIIPIHGQIYDKKSIIFGYGDEMTEYYKRLEDLDNEDVLKHFKSHHYPSNKSYSELLYEVETNEFDVVVFGHSLGLSDRLLLNTIFENENCKAIHLFHSGEKNHFKKRISLSRHFDDKKKFRKKLMEENDYFKIERK